MNINHKYTIPKKNDGPGLLAYNGEFYGTEDYTWDFKLHWPVISIDFVERYTGKNIIMGAGGSLEQAEINLHKIARISRMYINNKIPLPAQRLLEYRVAKDPDTLLEVLLFQLEILQTWGGYNSLYRVTETPSVASIGAAAEIFFNSSSLKIYNYGWTIPEDKYRVGY